MARVFVDVGVFGEQWFLGILDDLINSPHVRFSYGVSPKLLAEHERAIKVRRFFSLIYDMKKRDDADPVRIAEHIRVLEENDIWRQEKDCDDPHIFAIVFEKPVTYVFSSDKDLANCRKCINKVMDKRYCAFRLIASADTYLAHRPTIHAP